MRDFIVGLAIVFCIALCAVSISSYIAFSAVIIAIIVGAVVGNLLSISKKYNGGIGFAQKSILSFAIALMGINLDFGTLSALGLKTILLIVASMVFTITIAILLGRIFKLDTKLTLLLGFGNGICGSSAISATAPIIKADKTQIAISIAVVNLLGTVGMFLVPFIGHLAGLSDINNGILVGNTLQAVGQATAGGFSVSYDAGLSATAVKMGRVLLLTPLIFILIYIFKEKNTTTQTGKISIPLFIIFFVIFSIVGSLGILDKDITSAISWLSHICLIVAMGGIGLSIGFRDIKSQGTTVLKVASFIFSMQIIFSLLFLSYGNF